ncbi:putative nedd8 conjugating enzyme [Paratrimastix pyriformis]|uniref:Nedd8 conjugating enzyme n=1 Tax=Paratrimastix pyriformis TaxID=342808 RepID=A0ABQ8UCY5_9EUKA|nr:putative nedd8 conjugating enzyme [Paratrimastix pyriformis]
MLNLRAKKEAAVRAAAAQAAAQAASPLPPGSRPAPLQRAHSIRTLTVIKDLEKLDLPNTVRLVHPNPTIIREFYLILSPDAGIWTGGHFKFYFSFPADYNLHPPMVRCQTQILHPNIDHEGHVCLNILRDMEWTAVMDVQSVVFGLLLLFYEPNVSDPLNIEAAEEMKANLEAFKQKVRRTFQGGNWDGFQYERQPIRY